MGRHRVSSHLGAEISAKLKGRTLRRPRSKNKTGTEDSLDGRGNESVWT